MEENKNLLNRLLSSFQKQEGLDDLLLMAEHWNGFKRENAVRRLGMLGNPIAIPKLVVRVNDWVPQVREAARKALLKLMTPKNAKAFAECLPDIFHLKTCGRDNHTQFIAEVQTYLLKDENAESIREVALSLEPVNLQQTSSFFFTLNVYGKGPRRSRGPAQGRRPGVYLTALLYFSN
jgi:hypothetical protein